MRRRRPGGASVSTSPSAARHLQCRRDHRAADRHRPLRARARARARAARGDRGIAALFGVSLGRRSGAGARGEPHDCRDPPQRAVQDASARALQGLRGALFTVHTRRLRGWLLHTPNYVLMPFDGPTLTTVHDLSWLSYPEAHPVERVKLSRSPSARNARARESRADRFGVHRRRDRLALRLAAREDPRDSARRRRGIPAAHGRGNARDAREARFERSATIFSSSRRSSRARISHRLVRAYAALPAAMKSRHPLVIVGARGWLKQRSSNGLSRRSKAAGNAAPARLRRRETSCR